MKQPILFNFANQNFQFKKIFLASSIPEYVSDNEVEMLDETQRPTQRKAKKKLNNGGKVSIQRSSIEKINKERTWSYHYKNNAQDGNKINFRCNNAKLSGTSSVFEISTEYYCW